VKGKILPIINFTPYQLSRFYILLKRNFYLFTFHISLFTCYARLVDELAVGTGVLVAEGIGELVEVGTGEAVADSEGLAEADGETLAEGEAVAVAVGDGLAETEAEATGEGKPTVGPPEALEEGLADGFGEVLPEPLKESVTSLLTLLLPIDASMACPICAVQPVIKINNEKTKTF
jgi:hypothetical protein